MVSISNSKYFKFLQRKKLLFSLGYSGRRRDELTLGNNLIYININKNVMEMRLSDDSEHKMMIKRT